MMENAKLGCDKHKTQIRESGVGRPTEREAERHRESGDGGGVFGAKIDPLILRRRLLNVISTLDATPTVSRPTSPFASLLSCFSPASLLLLSSLPLSRVSSSLLLFFSSLVLPSPHRSSHRFSSPNSPVSCRDLTAAGLHPLPLIGCIERPAPLCSTWQTERG